jgi:upstream activation factor subunit UAF30
MPKKSSTETKQSAPAPAQEPVVDAKSVKKAKAPKAAPAPAPVVDPTPAPVVPETVVETPASTEDAALVEQSNAFLAKLHQLNVVISSLKSEYKALEKKWSRDLKLAQKQSSKRKRKSGNRAPSGFVKPTKISDELAVFLGKDKGSEMARTDVTREINNYIRQHKLQDTANGRHIIPDAKLKELLKLNAGDSLTYFNLQKYMSKHFAKAVKA